MSVAVGALTGAIVLFASIFIITFTLGWFSQARDRITHFRNTGRKFELSREILYAILPMMLLLMFFIAPLLGRQNVFNLNDKEWFSIAFVVYALLLVYICSKPKKLKKFHRMT
jgi:TRAP-type C4-dicarboxylate transport system permease small subunit